MTDEPEIERCVCGLPGRLIDEGGAYYVDCPAWDEPPYPDGQCWIGPTRTTREAALAEWNAIMRAAKEVNARRNADTAMLHLVFGHRPCQCAACLAYPFAMKVGDDEVARFKANAMLDAAAKERARLQFEIVMAHDRVVEEWGGIETAGGRYEGELPTDEEVAAGAWPFKRCTCPDCNEHRARVKETTT